MKTELGRVITCTADAAREAYRIGGIIKPFIQPERETEAVLAIYRELTLDIPSKKGFGR